MGRGGINIWMLSAQTDALCSRRGGVHTSRLGRDGGGTGILGLATAAS